LKATSIQRRACFPLFVVTVLTVGGCRDLLDIPGDGTLLQESDAAPSEERREICNNGIDDDGNGRIDCADEACQSVGYTCVRPPDSRIFSDTASVQTAASESELDACENPFITPQAGPGGSYAQLFGGALHAPTACSPCRCAAAGACSALSVRTYPTATCAGMPQTAVVSPQCASATAVTLAPQSSLAISQTAPAGALRCDAKQAQPVHAAFERVVRVCVANQLPAAGCESGFLCAPPPSRSAKRARCTLAKGTGEATCPPDYPIREVLFEGMEDDRSCSACTCSAPTNQKCTARLRIAEIAGEKCGADIASTEGDACLALPRGGSLSIYGESSPDADCSVVAGGEAKGRVNPGKKRTLCCAAQ
jgi:hypothetical protein